MTKNASVPHHRVDAAIHGRARRRAERESVSLSQVAEAGLRRYIEQHPAVAASAAPAEKPALPKTVVVALTQMKSKGDSRLDSALAALHSAGWSFATLASPIGMSRQAVHLRVTKAAPGWPLATEMPEGPTRASRTTDSKRFDWAVWVDKSVYVLASKTAKQRGDVMRDVMESILVDYLANEFAVPAADTQDTSTDKRVKTR